MDIDATALLIALTAGVALGCNGIFFRLGQGRDAPASAMLVVAAGGSAVFFALRTDPSGLAAMPGFVWLMAGIAGSTQYAAVLLFFRAMRRGGVSPAWCAISLGFLLVALVAWIAFGETLSFTQLLGLLAGIAAVLFGGASRKTPTPEPSDTEPRFTRNRSLGYALLLAAVLIAAGAINVCIKALGMRPGASGESLLAVYEAPFFALTNFTIVLCASIHLLMRNRGCLEHVHRGLWPSLGMVMTSCVFLLLVARASLVMPAALVFTVSGIASLLTGAGLAAIIFRERLCLAWGAMMACGAACIVLFNL